jgi:carboxypeptidase C (cathepsin A)
MYGTLSHIGY